MLPAESVIAGVSVFDTSAGLSVSSFILMPSPATAAVFAFTSVLSLLADSPFSSVFSLVLVSVGLAVVTVPLPAGPLLSLTLAGACELSTGDAL
jgi:hypothetical protein